MASSSRRRPARTPDYRTDGERAATTREADGCEGAAGGWRVG